MSANTDTAAYLLGHDAAELARLEGQARLLAPATQALFARAGIRPGMRVLDLGTGVGDVALLAARQVGTGGSVVGIDISPVAIATARQRAQRDKVGNVSFLEADLRTVDPARDLGGPFDAIVGRLVLLYMADPADFLARMASGLRPDGLVLVMEYDMTISGTVPATSLSDQVMAWLLAGFGRTGHDPALGARLGLILGAAGLEAPQSLGLQAYLAPDDPTGPRLLATTIRSLLPAILSVGIATAAEVDIDTLEQRLGESQRAAGAVVRPPTLVGAWAHASDRRSEP